jgi:hypothetical protein
MGTKINIEINKSTKKQTWQMPRIISMVDNNPIISTIILNT